MRAISLFSGVGGFELGFERAGIETVLQVESDAVCRSVLERHWPDVERLNDVRSVRGGWRSGRVQGTSVALAPDAGCEATSDVDLIYGGFPCQDVSVAGQRAGLSGERSGLWHEFQRVLRELRPRWCVIENVPGLLSSGAEPGADFGVVLRGLVDLGYGVAWRVLDARWFGVPQRRRRVFIVGCLGDPQRAAQVLAVCESCGGHPQARGQAGQDVAYALDDGLREPGLYAAEPDGVSRPLVARESGYCMDLETENFLVAGPVRASDGHHGHSSPRGDGADNLLVADPISAHEGKTYTHEGKNNFRMHDVVTAWDDRNQAALDDTHHTLRGAGLQRSDVMSTTAGVRRLTPLECERLQGWPDEHTRYGVDEQEIPDSHRYRCIGNGVVAPVAEWLGHRLMWVESQP